MAKKGGNKVGSLLFAIGAGVAIIGGFFYQDSLNATLSSVLLVLGIAVGLMNVTLKETTNFLLATVSLVIITSLGGAVLGQVPLIGSALKGILSSVLTFVIPAALIVALKSVYSLAQD